MFLIETGPENLSDTPMQKQICLHKQKIDFVNFNHYNIIYGKLKCSVDL